MVTTVDPACATQRRGANAMPSLVTMRPSAPSSFPVSRSILEDGGIQWEFPVTTKGATRAALVTNKRSSTFLEVTLVGDEGESHAELVRLDSVAGQPGGYLVAIPTVDGQCVLTRVVPAQSPGRAASIAERIEFLEDDKNWKVDGEPTVRAGVSPSVDPSSPEPTPGLAFAAAKAARLASLIEVVKDSMRSRAELSSIARQDDDAMRSLELMDAQIARAVENSRMPLETLSV